MNRQKIVPRRSASAPERAIGLRISSRQSTDPPDARAHREPVLEQSAADPEQPRDWGRGWRRSRLRSLRRGKRWGKVCPGENLRRDPGHRTCRTQPCGIITDHLRGVFRAAWPAARSSGSGSLPLKRERRDVARWCRHAASKPPCGNALRASPVIEKSRIHGVGHRYPGSGHRRQQHDLQLDQLYSAQPHSRSCRHRPHGHDHARREKRASFSTALLPRLRRSSRPRHELLRAARVSRRLHGHHRIRQARAHLRGAGLRELF